MARQRLLLNTVWPSGGTLISTLGCSATPHPPFPCKQAPGIDFDCGKAAALAQAARDRGMLAGIALTPDTQPEAVFPLCEAGQVDTVLLLAVRAGFGGQVRGAGLRWVAADVWLGVAWQESVQLHGPAQPRQHGSSLAGWAAQLALSLTRARRISLAPLCCPR